MKIVIAMDSFKESMSAKEACESVVSGFKPILQDAEYILVPMADGGEGTVQSLVDATNGEIVETTVTGPHNQKVKSFYGMLGDKKTAVIEMASASGLEITPKEFRNPMKTTTIGTGELIAKAIKNGASKIIMGIGGSATNDGGVGLATSLGIKFLDKEQKEIVPCGGELHKIHTIDKSNMIDGLEDIEFIVACDVDNPLTGENGASYVYGPQKGADSEMVKVLDNNLKHLANVIENQLGMSVDNVPGAGAAGGLGAGAIAFLNATLKKGVDIVIETVDLHSKIQDANLVITGEGRIDKQTAFGKTPVGVAKTAKHYNIPVIGIAGCLGDGCETVYDHGIDTVFSIVNNAISIDEAIASGQENLENTAHNIAKVIKLVK